MPTEGTRDAGDDSLSTLDTSAEVNEKDYKEGQLRKSGQRIEIEEEKSTRETGP